MNNFQSLAEALQADGWKYKKVEDWPKDTWISELWELRSVWSSVGMRTYLSFLIDPANVGTSRETDVWCIQIIIR